MDKTWKTKDEKRIPYKDLELSHLKNIIKWIEKKAKDGMTLVMDLVVMVIGFMTNMKLVAVMLKINMIMTI